MVSQTLVLQATDTERSSGRFFVDSIPTPPIYLHIITLIHRATGKEECLHIETLSDRFVDVMREITHQKAIRKLFGYEVFEVLDCNDPF